MASIDWILELVLVGLLGITLVHAIRLERALRSLRQDRAALGDAISGIDDTARQAELGLGRLQWATTESSQALAERLEKAGSLRDDLAFLIERGESVADRLDEVVRASRSTASAVAPYASPSVAAVTGSPSAAVPPPVAAAAPLAAPAPAKVRSQAERDLLLALRGVQ